MGGGRRAFFPLSLSLPAHAQAVFMVDNALGTSVSGPLPEGIEERRRPRSPQKKRRALLPSFSPSLPPSFAATVRYYFDGQTILKPGVMGDSAILILRGEVAHRVHEIGTSGANAALAGMKNSLRQVEALVPEGCAGDCTELLEAWSERRLWSRGNCLHRAWEPEGEGWLGAVAVDGGGG